MDNIKPKRDILNSIDAIAQASLPIKVRKKVTAIPIEADKIKYFNFLPLLSANKPKKGAIKIINKLALELDIPSANVLSGCVSEDAK